MDSFIVEGRPFTPEMAADSGVTRQHLRELVRDRLVKHVLHGVYLDARVLEDARSRSRCLALRLPPGAAICRRTTARLYGVDPRSPEEAAGPLAVECVVPIGTEPVARPGVRGYVAPLAADDVVIVDDLPCTTPLRTTIDVLRWLRPHMGLAVADAFAARGLVEVDDVRVEVERFHGCPGVGQARYLAALIEAATESFGESWLRLRIVDAGFPRPVVQIEVCDDEGRVVYRLDLGWPDRRLAIEYDGEEWHSSPLQRRHDAFRREVLLDRHGWTVIGVGKGEVLGASLALERAVGELLSMSPRSTRRRW